ncbi:hypothetical protein [Neobacillus cucumis]|uniref:hypothetical protein n=1 Tax=Neobacillus cucumis TaxID=1740721 RepID=UPI002E1D965C|nr:hypothetical protein [Neobacillus cucumis]
MTQNFDPFEMWKSFYNQYSTSFDEKMKEQFPSQAMAQLLDVNLLHQKMLNETTERYLEKMNVPTRSDMAKISSLIINVDSKVDDLEELLEETNAEQQSIKNIQSQIRDLSKQLESLETKLNQILTQLNSLNDEHNKKAATNIEAANVKVVTNNKGTAKNKETATNKK